MTLPPQKCVRVLREEVLLNEAEWRKCKGTSKTDVVALMHWMERHAFIQHPEHGKMLIPLRTAQREILEAWVVERYTIVLKARQIGWSTLAALYALWLSFFWPDQLIIMLSKGDREAMKLLAKSTYAYDRLPDWMRARGPRRMSKNLKKLSFDNASQIESLPSQEDPARSSTASLVFVDEWAFLDNPEEAWASIEPIADVGGRVIGLSTANGSGNFFHTFWLQAEQGITNFKPLFYAWFANSDRDQNWYEAKKRTMPGWQLAQEYPSNPDEAFIKSGNPVFDTDQLLGIETIEPVNGFMSFPNKTVKSATHRTDMGGPLDQWEMPERGHGYVIGADVAEGLDYGDYSSAHVIDIKTQRVVATWHGHTDPDLFGYELAALGYYYNTALIGPEVNNHGLTTCKTLQRISYPRIYYRKSFDDRTKVWSDKVGWATTQKSKPLMIDDLVQSLRENQLELPCSKTISELRTYVRDDKGKMHGSPHDDRVISLAIAKQMMEYQWNAAPQESRDTYWTMDWWRGLLNEVGVNAPMGSRNVRR